MNWKAFLRSLWENAEFRGLLGIVLGYCATFLPIPPEVRAALVGMVVIVLGALATVVTVQRMRSLK